MAAPPEPRPAAPWLPCAAHGEARALRAGGLHWRYAQLAERAEARAAELARRGVRAGQVVAVAAADALDLLVMQHTLPRLDAALLVLDPALGAGTVAALARATGAEWRWDGPSAQAFPLESGAQEHGSAARDSAPAVLVRSSGSSGGARVAMLSAANVAASCGLVNARLRLGAGDAWLCCLPRHHVGGLAPAYRCALAGAELRVHARFDAAAVAAALRAGGVTHVSLVPAMLARLLEHAPAPPPGLRVVLLGGQRLDPGLARRAAAAGWPLYLGYGMTETFSQVAGAWLGGDGKPAAGLAPLPGVEVDCAPCGAAGSAGARPLRLRGPMCMLGYANPQRRPGDGLAHGWLATADLGCCTGGGGLEILGRADDRVTIGGLEVLPGEVEARLADAPGLGEAAIAAVAEPIWGHRLVLLYTGPAEPAALAAWCRAQLPSHLRPRGFRRLPALPLLSAGKVDRRRLAALAAETDPEPG